MELSAPLGNSLSLYITPLRGELTLVKRDATEMENLFLASSVGLTTKLSVSNVVITTSTTVNPWEVSLDSPIERGTGDLATRLGKTGRSKRAYPCSFQT